MECLLAREAVRGRQRLGQARQLLARQQRRRATCSIPGDTPHENAQFLVFCAAVIRAVHKYGGLLRASVASATNDHRLGANEAPPAIISIFLGDQLADVFEQIAKGAATSSKGKGTLTIGVDTLPMLPTDAGDRNRTSPFAFTGNRFEFRAPGSMQSIAGPLVVHQHDHGRVARLHRDRAGERRRRTAPTSTPPCRRCSTTIITEHGAVVFNGDGYSDEWQIEAEPSAACRTCRTTLDALPELISEPDAMALFEKYKVFNHREMHSRYEIGLEQYVLTRRRRGQPDPGDRHDADPAGRGPVPDGAGAQRRRPEGGRRRGRHLDAGRGLGHDRRAARQVWPRSRPRSSGPRRDRAGRGRARPRRAAAGDGRGAIGGRRARRRRRRRPLAAADLPGDALHPLNLGRQGCG